MRKSEEIANNPVVRMKIHLNRYKCGLMTAEECLYSLGLIDSEGFAIQFIDDREAQ